MRFFDLQLKQIKRSDESSEQTYIGFFVGLFLVLKRTFTKREVLMRHIGTTLIKSFLVLLALISIILLTTLLSEILYSGYSFFGYFRSFSEQKPVVQNLFYLFVFCVFCFITGIISFTHIQRGNVLRIVKPSQKADQRDVVLADIAPHESVDLWTVLTPQSKKIIEESVGCAHFWQQSSLDYIHIIKCLALYSNHIQHIFMRLGLSHQEFIAYAHKNLSEREVDNEPFNASYLAITLSRAYSVALTTFELQISPLSILEGILMHDAQARDLFESMGVAIEDVVALIELERVHERREQYCRFGILPKKKNVLLFGITRSQVIGLYESYLTTHQIVLECSNEVAPTDLEMIHAYVSRITHTRRKIIVFNTRLFLDQFGVITSFLKLKKILTSSIHHKRLLQVNDAQLLILSYQDASMNYSALDLLVDAMQNTKCHVCIILSQTSEPVSLYFKTHRIPVINLAVSDVHARLYGLMGVVYEIENEHRIFFAYDALAYLALNVYSLHEHQHVIAQRIQALVTEFITEDETIIITSDMLRMALSK